jgi:hypothetical protein
MTKTRIKLISDHEKEEKWLNDQALKGLAMKSFIAGVYTFEETEPGEYIYRIELLEKDPVATESKAYISFMEDSGVELISTHFRWVYFRKKAVDGAFEIYSDMDSRITHYQRISRYWIVFGCLMVITAVIQISPIVSGLQNGSPFWGESVAFAVFGVLFMIYFFALSFRYSKRANRLKSERNIHE